MLDSLAELMKYLFRRAALGCGGVTLLAVVGFGLAKLGFGVLAFYADTTAVVAFMGWVVYRNKEADPGEVFVDVVAGLRLDIIDIVLILGALVAALEVSENFLGIDPYGLGMAGVSVAGIVAVWLRRRFLRWTTVLYHPKNIALRSAQVFCGLHFLLTLVFVLVSSRIDAPVWHVRTLILMTGVLFVLSAWFFLLEHRRQPSPSSVVGLSFGKFLFYTYSGSPILPYIDLGKDLLNEGKLLEAAASYRQALALRPDYAMAHYGLGIALAKQGKNEEAAASFRQALEIAPNYADAQTWLDITLAGQGKHEAP